MAFEWDDKELQNALSRLIEEAPEKVQAALQNACLKVMSVAQEKCPVGTGELRRSIQTEVTVDGDTIEGIVGTNIDYAPYVHQGTGIYAKDGNGRKEVPWVYYSDRDGHCYKTSGIKPTPFLQDAIDECAPMITDYFIGLMDNV